MISLVLFLSQGAQAAELEPTILTQVWATVFDQDVDEQADAASWGDPEDDPGLKIRRARMGFEGSDGDFSYGVVVGMSSGFDARSTSDGEIELVDAYGGWQFSPSMAVLAGVQKVPYSREQLMSAGELVFQDRSVAATHIAPGRDVGVMLDANAFGGHIQLGVFNGNDSILGDDNAGFLFAGRASYTLGGDEPTSTWGVADGIVWSTGSNVLYNQGTATDELNLGADLLLKAGALSVLAEGHYSSISPTSTDVASPGVFSETARLGGMLQIGYTQGLLEPAVRLEYFDDNSDSQDNGDIAIAMAGVTAHLSDDKVRAGVGFVHREELGGSAISNDTARFWFQFMQ